MSFNISNFKLINLKYGHITSIIECIPVGCVLPAAVAIHGGVCLHNPPGVGLEPPQVWAWRPPGCGPGDPPGQTPQLPPGVDLDSGGSKGGARDAHPLGAQILSISCSFRENMAKSYVGAPLGSWHPLLREILDLALLETPMQGMVGYHLQGMLGYQTPPLWTEWQTGAKILPCPKLRLRAVNICFLCQN